ncbi:heterokaryon incompatibility protein-domain-containing protein [Ampelomyces quisqualis]|uniref:Heterokaryon incompatibility protein-domain-containing protein n=1 Tax=Ampelomyces quisqualis TaxID=50730 RepID=A0A6A5QEE1_AMPQU|nr:heterokaryon incompatibility protein-domain-containing protein [Ampelomyces quisqualis]
MDPFGLKGHVATSAISTKQSLAPNIYEGLFDKIFFDSEEFSYWSRGSQPWQLHCYGAPGCGKTTLAIIAARRLLAIGGAKKRSKVVSLFIDKDVLSSSVTFLEDFLHTIYLQLGNTSLETHNRYEQYERACQNGESITKRLTLLRGSLCSRLDGLDHSFLIFDGYDRLGEELQVLIDGELSLLQSHRLRVLKTRRVPVYEIPLFMACDGPQCENPQRLNLFRVCKKCLENHPDEYSAFCYDCIGRGSKCAYHPDADLEEPYNHVNINVSRPDELEDYIKWDLGDLYAIATKAESSSRMPHGSTADTTAPLPDHGERLQKIVSSISAAGNITIAKLYLDSIHKYRSFDVVERVGDRLPRNIIALFDAEMKRIQQRPKYQSDIAMMAIAAAADKDSGVALTSLEECMRDAMHRLPHLVDAPPRSLGEIICYANGFLEELYSDVRTVGTYSPFFALYAREHYNETLFWAKNQLNVHRVSRSMTFQPKLTSEPLVASPPTMEYDFDSSRRRTEQSPRGSMLEYFDRFANSKEVAVSPRQDPPTRRSADSFDIRMFRRSDRRVTMGPGIARNNDSRSSIVQIPEEIAPDDRPQPHSKRSMSKSSSRLCAFCEEAIFASQQLQGTYQRQYSQVKLLVAKRCVFCSVLYKDFLELPMQARDAIIGNPGPTYHWKIRSTAKSRESRNSIVVSFIAGGRHGNTTEGLQQDPVNDSLRTSDSHPHNKQFVRHFHLVSEHDLGHVPDHEDLGTNTDPAGNAGRQISEWVKECDQLHASCSKVSKSTWVPTRLLDLRFGDLKSVKLIVRPADQGITGPYVTLSHCWGPKTKENEFLTTQKEMEKVYMTKGIKISALSVNFQHAISVARFIGVRYMWIDSLCIIQGPGSDFHSEGQLMHKVYRYSYLNIAAADSVDSRGGLYRGRDPAAILPGKYQGDGSSAIFGTTTWRIVPENLWEDRLLESSIYTRGWVFQERMLAPRVLHFTHDQIFWDCGNLSACEALPKGLPLALDDAASTDRHWRGRLQESSSLAHAPLSGANDDSLSGFWSSAVLNYTKCNLTNQSDKSVAIWSIAKLVRDAWSDEYGAGMWGTGLEEQLSWKVADVRASVRDVHLQWKQPSWSWTSVRGAVSLPERIAAKRCYRVRGHDRHAITFSTKGATRPTAERVHSDSMKEDIKLGWREWQKKTRTQSSPVIRKDMKEERSQSVPVRQASVVKSTMLRSSKIGELRLDPRDLEPVLESKAVAMNTPLGTGTLHQYAGTDRYYFSVSHSATDGAVQDHLVNMTLEAWPDEVPTELDLLPNNEQFLILTITAHHTTMYPSGLGIEMFEYDLDNKPELPTHTTYSGTGLIVVKPEEYLHRGDFYAKVKHARTKLSQFLDENSPVNKGSDEEGKVKGMQDEIDTLDGLILDLERHREGEEAGRHYRRMGVLEFQGWDESMYRRIVDGEFVDVWLD